jgi:excisionase family DNA binding protein
MRFRVPEQLLLPFDFTRTISTSHCATILGVSVGTVLRMIEDGTLQAYRVRNGLTSPWRINYESLVAYSASISQKNGLETRFER